jgi:hypothetical protein
MKRQALGVTSMNYRALYALLASVLVGLALLLMPGTGRAQSENVAQAMGPAVSFRVEPAIVDLRSKKKAKRTKVKCKKKKKKKKCKGGRGKGVWMVGSGLEPGQKVDVYVTMLGAESDISFMLRPKPKADAKGWLKTSWEIRPKRFSRIFGDKLTFEFRDSKTQKLLATAPLSVCKAGKKNAAPWCGSAKPLLPIESKNKKWKVKGLVTKVKRGGRRVYIGGRKMKVSKSKTRVTINGSKGKRSQIKVGMKCKVKGKGKRAKKISCK